MRPRFRGRLGMADAITIGNAILGLVAAVLAPTNPELAARLILVAAMGDGLDGIVARWRGGTAVGESLDALSDIVSFGVAPAMLVVSIATPTGLSPWLSGTGALVVGVAVAGSYFAMVQIRLGLYIVYDSADHSTLGVPASLPAIGIATAVLITVIEAPVILASVVLLSYLMVAEINYPDLLPRDVFLMGVVQGLTVLFPHRFGQAFPYALLVLALAYLILAPRFYWRDQKDGPVTPGERPEGKRS